QLPLEEERFMPQNSHAEGIIADEDRHPESTGELSNLDAYRAAGAEFSARLGWLPGTPASQTFMRRARRLRHALKPVFAAIEGKFQRSQLTDDMRWLRDNVSLIYSEMVGLPKAVKPLHRLPHVRNRRGQIVPRALEFCEFFLESVGCQFSEQAFSAFCQGFQQNTPMELRELWALIPGLKIALLGQIALRGRLILRDPKGESRDIGTCIRSLREVVQSPWKEVIEPLIVFDKILREDPAGAYPAMDFDSRNFYRDKLAKIARRSDCSEVEVAREAIALAKQARDRAYRDPRIAAREAHVGYYLIAEGRRQLCQKVGCKQDFFQSLRALLRRHPDEFYLPGTAILTFAIITPILLWLTPPYASPGLVLLSMLILVLPASQSAVQLMNYIVTALLPAQILPKFDFSEGIPDEFLTLIAVPTLLLNEKQVRGLVDDLEVRFLGNHDP